MPRHHLLAVWNPVAGPNLIESHLRVLQDAARNYRAERCTEDDVYVWWGRVLSPDRSQPPPHLSTVLDLPTETQRHDPAPETHVYLTDFASLYVAHLGEITTADPRADRGERGRVPGHYRKQHLECDLWFRLWDIRRLVDDDLPMTVHELQKLRNVRDGGRCLSVYGGIVDLPLIVTEPDERRYFDLSFRDTYTNGVFWVEFDAERGGVAQTERELREHMFGNSVWQSFGPTTRLFIATAEKIFRDHYRDVGFDFSPVLVEYCKAIEVRCNDLLRRGLSHLPEGSRALNQNGKSVVLGEGNNWNLRQLAHFLSLDRGRCEDITRRFDNGAWFAYDLPAVLSDLAEFRGPAAHSTAVDREDAVRWRNQLCGIGCHGHLLNLAKVKPKVTTPSAVARAR